METIYISLHVLSFLFVIWSVVRADHMGYLWFTGKVKTLEKSAVKKHHHSVMAGFILMIITGALVFSTVKANIIYPQFYIKMSFVLALFVNSFIIGKLSNIAITKSFDSLTSKEKLPIYISAIVSTVSWIGATIMALFILAE